MKMFISISAIIILVSVVQGAAEDNYYYSDNRQISLTPDSQKIVIGFVEEGYGQFDQLVIDYPILQDTMPPNQVKDDYYIFHLQYPTNIDSLIDILNKDSTIKLSQPVFINEAGGEEAFTDRIVIK